SDVLTVNGNLPRRDIVETGQEIDNRALATARSAQDSRNLARYRVNRDLLQRWYTCVIREGDLVEPDMPTGPSHLSGLRLFDHRRAGVEHFKQALPGGDRPRQAINDACRLTYRESELVHVQDKLGQAAGGQMATHDFPAAKPQDHAQRTGKIKTHP